MQTECYALNNQVERKLPPSDEGLEEVERRNNLLQETGLTGRLHFEIVTAEKSDKLWLATQAYPELTGRTFRLWRRFLPTTSPTNEYRYDAVPVEALEAIRTAQQLDCFDRIEIWTPEGNSMLGIVARKVTIAKDKLAKVIREIDPMAVGIVVDPDGNEHYYQLVRWGEALLPISTIKRHVRSVNWRMRLLFQILPVLMGCIALVSYSRLIERFGFVQVIALTIYAVLCIALIGLVVSVLTRPKKESTD